MMNMDVGNLYRVRVFHRSNETMMKRYGHEHENTYKITSTQRRLRTACISVYSPHRLRLALYGWHSFQFCVIFLIRLRKWPDWPENSLGVHIILQAPILRTFSNHSLSRDMTKPTKWLCAQRKLRSACASAQSYQSLHCPQEESLDP